MKYMCESGKHLLFDSDAKHSCGSCASLAALIARQIVSPKQLRFCKTHREKVNAYCISCQFALDWNLMGRYCKECGEPAIGYSVQSLELPVGFYCDTHFQGVQVEHGAGI